MFGTFGKDLQFFCKIERPGIKPGVYSMLATCFSHRGLWLLTGYRLTHFATYRRDLRNPLWWVARVMEAVGYYVNAVASKSEMLGDCAVPGPIYLSRRGHYMIGAKSIGPGTVLQCHITFGMTVAGRNKDRPTVGQDVWIGSDCVIAGKLHIGDGATILPGSYVTFDIPARSVAGGNPARILKKDYDNSTLRHRGADLPWTMEILP